MKENEVKIKRTSKGAIVAIIIGTVLLNIGIIVGIVLLVIKLIPRDYKGTWSCDNNTKLVIDSDSFYLYKNNYLNTTGYYSVNKININNDKRRFILNVYNSHDSYEYEMIIDDDNLNLIEKNTYTTYKCIKK